MNEPVLADIDSLIPYENNSRIHSDTQIEQLANSIDEFGFVGAIVVRNGVIAKGHGCLAAMRLLISQGKEIYPAPGKQAGAQPFSKDNHAPVIDATGWTDSQFKAYVIADNKLALNADWDLNMVRIELEDLKLDNFDLDTIGFDASELAEIFSTGDEGNTDEDDAPEPQERAKAKLGDVWILDNHRLVCGDSTDPDVVAFLMGGQKADMVFTDPPYGINEKGDRTARKTGLAKNHNFKDFIDDSIQYAVDAYKVCEKLRIPRQVWWGANYYCHSLPQSNNWFIWDKRVEEKLHDTQSDCEMAWVKSEFSSIRIFRHLWKGFNKDSERNIPRVHPTQKPVALAVWSFDYFKKVHLVLDLFGGSGSTLIACEKTNRYCYMMEIDPIYVDVIIKRWQDFTGKIAVNEQTGTTFNKTRYRKAKP